MRLILACPIIAATMLSACDKSTPPAPAPGDTTPSATTATTATTAAPASAPPAAPAPATTPPSTSPAPQADAPAPFAQGFCEVVRDGGAPEKTPGGMAAVSTWHWAGPATNNPPWPLMLNCGTINLSAAGSREQFPMAAGTFPVLGMGEPDKAHFTVMAFPFQLNKGTVTIEAWDMAHIRGSFELAGRVDGNASNIKGSFDLKCPYTKPGEPCLDKPLATP